MRRNLPRLLFVLLLLAPVAARAGACQIAVSTPLQMISLADREAVKRLENENRLSELCPNGDKACTDKALAPEHRRIPVHGEPGGEPIGTITVIYAPGKPLTATIEARNAAPVPYTPAAYDPDWGYGPWFHATLLDRRDDWALVPLPGIGAGWLSLPGADIRDYRDDGGGDFPAVFRFGAEEVVILRHDKEGATLRAAAPGEECGHAAPPPGARARTLPYAGFYGSDCNLLLLPASLRGC